MAQNTDPYGYVYVFKNEYMPGLKKKALHTRDDN